MLKIQTKLNLITFGIVVLCYLGIGALFQDNPEGLNFLSSSQQEKLWSLPEEDKIALIQLDWDNRVEWFEKDSLKTQLIASLNQIEFEIVQSFNLNQLERAKWMYIMIRLILLAFLFTSVYIYFTQTVKFSISFQKALFTATKLTVLFAVFVLIATLFQILLSSGFSLNVWEVLLFQFVNMLKTGLLYSVAISVFIYFHPHNQLRIQQKKQRKN